MRFPQDAQADSPRLTSGGGIGSSTPFYKAGRARMARYSQELVALSAQERALRILRAQGFDIEVDPENNHGFPWPLPNVWLGVSAEDQKRLDERVPELLATPAAVRWISAEPLLGPLDFNRNYFETIPERTWKGYPFPMLEEEHRTKWLDLLDWVVVGGESGPGARPMDIAWARDIVRQCSQAGVACFVKQLGAKPYLDYSEILPQQPDDADSADIAAFVGGARGEIPVTGKGGDPSEWPEELRVREWPEVRP